MSLMTTIFVVCGHVNYTNLSRYSPLSEKTYRRHFESGLVLEPLNQALIRQVSAPQAEQIVVVDCTFIEKSGKHTEGLDWFYNGKTQRSQRGLEWSVIAIVDIAQQTGYTLSAQQTEAGLAATSGSSADDACAQRTRMDFYFGHFAYVCPYLPPQVRYALGDGFYSKRKWVNGVIGLNLHAIGKLRCDANLKFLYDGPQKPKGRRRRYVGKVDLSQTQGLEFVCDLEDGSKLYTAVVWSVGLARQIRVAYVLKEQNGKRGYVVLFSTDIELDARDICRYYRARFQIEFIFRDARQFTGLADCQARNADALDSHVNASLCALNLAKAAMRHEHSPQEPMSFSLASFKRRALNEHLLEQFARTFEVDAKGMQSHAHYTQLLNYGAISP